MNTQRKTRSAPSAPPTPAVGRPADPTRPNAQADLVAGIPTVRFSGDSTAVSATSSPRTRWRAVIDFGTNPNTGQRIRKYVSARNKTDLQAAVDRLIERTQS